MCGKNFSIYGVHIPRKCIESMHIFFSHASVPHSKLLLNFLENGSPKSKWVEETMICFIKIQSENLMTWNISLFRFCMICNFSKCDGFTVM